MSSGVETAILKDILGYCAQAGIFAKRRNVAGAQRVHGHFIRMGEKGQADLWGILPRSGRHWECEVKQPGEKPSDKQMEWLNNCRASGAAATWVTSLDNFVAWMEEQL